MIRRLFQAAVRLYPRDFRERYGEELLETFDQARGACGGLRLLVDTVAAAIRRRLSNERVAPEAPVAGPMFFTTPASTLRSTVLLQGAAAAVAAFLAVGFAITHGAPSGVMRLPRVVTASSNVARPGRMAVLPQWQTPAGEMAPSLPRRPPVVVRVLPEPPTNARRVAAQLFTDLDADRDLLLSVSELDGLLDPELRRKLAAADADGDRLLTMEEVLDALDRHGVVSRT